MTIFSLERFSQAI